MKSKLVLAIILCIQIQIAWAQARIRYDRLLPLLYNHLGKKHSISKMKQSSAGWVMRDFLLIVAELVL